MPPSDTKRIILNLYTYLRLCIIHIPKPTPTAAYILCSQAYAYMRAMLGVAGKDEKIFINLYMFVWGSAVGFRQLT